jgi:HAD superfamily hydrolase (TIGR01662 family)
VIRAILFDVDYTLIHPGPAFQGEGYRASCARHGIQVDADRFAEAVADASSILDSPDNTVYDDSIFVAYTRRIIEGMGGSGRAVDICAREMYEEWAACRHFELYEEVPQVLRAIAAEGVRIGLISNSHRCLSSFQTHFDLEGLIAAAVSSSEHGVMKPHPSIFLEALNRVDAAPDEALMVGDSVRHDVEGALGAGMRAALLHRGIAPHPLEQALAARGVPTIRTLHELPTLLQQPSSDARQI